MKPLTYLKITTLVLFFLVVFASLDFNYALIFSLTVVGQILLAITVFKVLKDNYTTEKTFKDFYEDATFRKN